MDQYSPRKLLRGSLIRSECVKHRLTESQHVKVQEERAKCASGSGFKIRSLALLRSKLTTVRFSSEVPWRTSLAQCKAFVCSNLTIVDFHCFSARAACTIVSSLRLYTSSSAASSISAVSGRRGISHPKLGIVASPDTSTDNRRDHSLKTR